MTTGKYNMDNYIEDALKKKHDNKPNRMIRQVLDDGTVIIGKNRYDALIKIPIQSRLKSQIEQIQNFEDYHGITEYKKNIQEQKKAAEDKLAAIENKKQEIIASINKESVKEVFKTTFRMLNKKPFKATKETVTNITPLLLYFAKDESFLNHGVKDENGKFLSKPSLNKGLCIIGGFGNGKTCIMNTFQRMFIGLDGFSFGRFTSHEIVRRFEDANKHNLPVLVDDFWKLMLKGPLYIDDVKAEPEALSYGKRNLLNALFQERYNKKLKTHISINYANGYNGDIKQALLEFKTKYSNQVYDRIFEMYNILEFKGTSFRR